MEHLLSAWPEVANRLRKARRVLLLTDYDGTLTPIVDRPELAVLSAETRTLLYDVSRLRHFTLGIISGRALFDLKDRVGIDGIIYAGNHGFEMEGPGIRFIEPVADDIKPLLRLLQYVLWNALGAIRGVFVEDKGLTLSVHYRLAEECHHEEVDRIVKRVVGPAEATGMARVTTGKKVYEIRPAVSWDKGKVIALLMKKYGHPGRQSGLLPIYLGDDFTDEDGFKVIGQSGGGLSILVGEATKKSAARYFLESPAEVVTFMKRLAACAKRGFRGS